MLPNNLSDLTKLEEVFFTSEEDLSHISQYGKSYHNPSSAAKCPRCQNLSELVEDSPIRSLYRCRDCGIFSKLTPKRQGSDGKPIECRLKNPCQGCQGKQGIITPVDRSTGNPHSYRLECEGCGRFQRWIGQREFDRAGDASQDDQKGGRDNA